MVGTKDEKTNGLIASPEGVVEIFDSHEDLSWWSSLINLIGTNKCVLGTDSIPPKQILVPHKKTR